MTEANSQTIHRETIMTSTENSSSLSLRRSSKLNLKGTFLIILIISTLLMEIVDASPLIPGGNNQHSARNNSNSNSSTDKRHSTRSVQEVSRRNDRARSRKGIKSLRRKFERKFDEMEQRYQHQMHQVYVKTSTCQQSTCPLVSACWPAIVLLNSFSHSIDARASLA